MEISKKLWQSYIDKMRKCNKTASGKMVEYIEKHGLDDAQAVIEYGYALATKYGEGSAALAAEMYDLIAKLQKVTVPAAETAATATLSEAGSAIGGALKKSSLPEYVGGAVERLVKQAGADTMIKNAKRDNAMWAWIPSGDTCAFCLTLASRGWQQASSSQIKGAHAQHIHANCDCNFCIRFNRNLDVSGYDPDELLDKYYSADGISAQDKVNSLRRIDYAENKDKINAQKRAAYAARKEAKEATT